MGTATTGSYNVAIGGTSMTSGVVTGNHNLALQQGALDALTSGKCNVAIGINALGASTTGCDNIAIGEGALSAGNTTGHYNIGIGGFTADAMTTGNCNIGIGVHALGGTTTGCTNIGIGLFSIYGATYGNCNVAMGYAAMKCLSAGCNGIALGYQALMSQTTGNDNIAIGTNALEVLTTGCLNVAIGHEALGDGILTGDGRNVGIGFYAGLKTCGGGACNVSVGNLAGMKNSTGCHNVSIGNAAGCGVTTQCCVINIGHLAQSTSTGTGCISTNLWFTGHQNSDCRAKTSIADSDLGLDFINAIRPVKYKYKVPRDLNLDDEGNIIVGTADPEGTQKSKQFEYGFIVQEIETVISNMGKGYTDFAGMVDLEIDQGKTVGTKAEEEADPENVWYPGEHCYDPDHPDYQVASASSGGGGYQKTKALRYEQFTAPVVKAIQELDAKNTALEARVATLEG
jgi:hypothetical protein